MTIHRMPGAIQRILGDVLVIVRFYTRLPTPAFAFESPERDFARFSAALWAVPIAGALVGIIGASVFYVGDRIGLPGLASGLLAVATLIAVTGGLHEDGLADTADGFWGGRDRAAKLHIMKDSRVGAFGVSALIVSIGLRAALISGFVGSPDLAAAAIVSATIGGRVAALFVPYALPPARADGASRAAGRPNRRVLAAAIVIGACFMLIAGLNSFGLAAIFISILAAAAAVSIVIGLARHHIDGQTGDTIGAAVQVVEIAILTAMATSLPG